MIASRRSLITGLASLLAAPAIVRATSMMPVKAWDDVLYDAYGNKLIRCAERLLPMRSLGLAQIKIEGNVMYFDFDGQG